MENILINFNMTLLTILGLSTMTFIILFIVSLIIILIVFIIIKALMFNYQSEDIVYNNEKNDNDNVAYKLGQLIKYKTISNLDKSKVDYKEFQAFIDKLKELYPNVVKHSEFEQTKDYSLIFKIRGKSSEKPTVLMAHYDVVPVTEGWEQDPFLGEVIDGYVYGRGTLDTKCTLVCIMSSLEKVLDKGYQPKNDLYVCFGSNEEVFGDSQINIVKSFKEKNIYPSLVLDEGGGILSKAFPGVKQDAAFVGVIEKGMLNIKLSIDSNGGHSSTPKKNGPVIRLSKALIKLDKNQMKPKYTPASKELLNIMGRNSSFALKLLLGNMWLFSGLVKKLFVKASVDTKALLSTTFAFTTINGGNVTNIIPNHVEANVNVRVAPFNSTKEVVEHINKVINKGCKEKDKIKVSVVFEQKMYKECSFTTNEYNIIKEAILETYDNTVVAPFIMLGGTDSRHYCEICENVFRLSPIKMTNTDRLGVHGMNEKIKVASLEKCLEFYDKLLTKI